MYIMVSDKKLQQMARDVAYERSQMWRSHQLQQSLMKELMAIAGQGKEAFMSGSRARVLLNGRQGATLCWSPCCSTTGTCWSSWPLP
jgi:hypothetical protein